MRPWKTMLFGASGTALLAGVLGTGLLSPRRTAAEVPAVVQAVQQQLADAQRLYLCMSIPFGRGPNGGFGDRMPVGLRYDLDAEKLSLDGHSFRYLYADGIATWHNHVMRHDRDPVRLPMAEPILADLLAELDQGLANSTWTREDPPDVRDGLHKSMGLDWYRVDLPFVWDDAYRIYIQLETIYPGIVQIAVLHADQDHMLVVQHPGKTNNTFFEVKTYFSRHVFNPDFTASKYDFPDDPFADRKYQNFSVRPDDYLPGPPEEPEY